MNLNTLRDECYQISKDHGFHEPPKSIGDDIALMHSELSEALEDHRIGKLPNEVWYERKHPEGGFVITPNSTDDGQPNKPCGIPSELADVLIRIFDFSGRHGIDIDTIVLQKIEFNRTRPFKHGNKIL